ncbi:MAG TPA: CoA pyrophosphatase [Lacipirellula sp.]
MNPPLWHSPALPELLAADLANAAEARWGGEFAPELSYGRHAGPPCCDTREAAVAVVLCWEDAGWSLPLTVRHMGLSRHGGQVSFPGGLVDEGESPCDAAAREIQEELGLRPRLQWLGELSPLFVYASNALVTPCVAALDHWPAWEPQPAEVDCVLRLELRQLLAPPTAPPLVVQRGPIMFKAPQLLVEGRSAWGATAVMLGELRGRLLRIAERGALSS